jgi:hypothetical protein
MDNTHMTKEQETEQNPFVYGKPVRISDFYNRDEIIRLLLAKAVDGKMQKDVWITGERQVGKTSLLRYIQSKYENINKKIKLYTTEEQLDAAFIYLNVQDTKTREDFYRNLRQSLKNVFDFKIEPLDESFNNFIEALKYLYLQQKYYIVFLVDEFDAFIQNMAADKLEDTPIFINELNKLLEEGVPALNGKLKIFSCIFAANRTIEDILNESGITARGSGLMVDEIELPWFNKEQVAGLANRYLKNYSIQFSDQETDFCFKMTWGYPYFVQQLYHIMYKQKIIDPDPKSYLSKVKEEYGKDFNETVKRWAGQNLPDRTKHKLKNLAKDLIKKVGDRSLSLLFKGIEEYIKMQMTS